MVNTIPIFFVWSLWATSGLLIEHPSHNSVLARRLPQASRLELVELEHVNSANITNVPSEKLYMGFQSKMHTIKSRKHHRPHDFLSKTQTLIASNQGHDGPPLALKSYISGKWDLNRTDNLKTLPLCYGRLAEEGEWIYALKLVKSPLKYEVWSDCNKGSKFSCETKSANSRLKSRLKSILETRLKEANKWVWNPSHCIFEQLDPISFIRRMNGKTLLFIGDSLQETASESLTCQLWQYVIEKQPLKTKFPSTMNSCIDFTKKVKLEAQKYPVVEDFAPPYAPLKCGNIRGKYVYAELDDGCWVKVLMIRAPFLGLAAAYLDRMTDGANTRLETWWGYILSQFGITIDIIIMNVGMHFSRLKKSLDPITEMNFLARRTQQVLSKNFRGKVIWRSLSQPIGQCSNLTKPLKDYKEWKAYNIEDYEWEKFEIYNKIWEETWEGSTTALNLLDIRPYTLFPFGHRSKLDCAHSCLPGPYDRWAGDWFWTILKQIVKN